MPRTRIKYEQLQRAITQKEGKQELWFLCTALPLNEIYTNMKYQVNTLNHFQDMPRTRYKYEKLQRAITQKVGKQEL